MVAEAVKRCTRCNQEWPTAMYVTYTDRKRIRDYCDGCVDKPRANISPARRPLDEIAIPVAAYRPIPATCPRCIRGRMFKERDRYGEYGTCMTCSFVHETTPPPSDEPEEGKARKRGAQHGRIKLS